MNKTSLSNLEFFKILDENHKSFYGCNQEWYPTAWQRMSGCGPSVASGIIWYISHCLRLIRSDMSANKDTYLPLMEDVWRFVTPTTRGIPTTKMFYESVVAYTESKGLNVEYHFYDIPKDESIRPEISDVLRFIEGGLRRDAPVAFLNLCNGEEENLEPWHWVTIVSMDYSDHEQRAFAEILDRGLIKTIDLFLWHKTTRRGGGFVYFTPHP